MNNSLNKNIEIAAVIGLGLIGGTFAYALRDNKIVSKIIGVEANEEHAKKALELGLVDEILPLDEAVQQADFIILATPVTIAATQLPKILENVDEQIVIDLGSTKFDIINSVKNHPKRGRYVASHPMWGTEFSGPEAAQHNVLRDRVNIICDKDDSDKDALEFVENFYRKIGMRLVYMNGEAHDVHLAYVSHISHITSFALANTVLEKEKEEDTIFNLASSGFESTVRLAKSNSATWVPVFKQNKENVLDVLNEYISQLRKFKSSLEKENWEYLNELIEGSNKIKKILK
ncbi:prephenate dehydrogenase [Arachidicoccus ginsenosidimutans]|uniref:prephenate dehydrogenase n=1 Tax=Arachidicoccus sp. BS20 TaxID=1850526 RepID=UPI0007F0B29D|nr:prephenate dehydrogenase [Arachidicoccus sp. BS20]ANI87943.1 prephenate dehydrogenase [Arachidicoccus sp. BS20]